MRSIWLYFLCAIAGFGLGLGTARALNTVSTTSIPSEIPIPTTFIPATVIPTPEPPLPITVIAVGDIMLGRSVMGRMRANTDFAWPVHVVADRLKSADLTIANLEAPFADDCPPSDSGYKFCADPKSVESLAEAGVDVVSLANNHIYNYGQTAIDKTKMVLNEAGIAYIGLNQPVYKMAGNKTIAFIGFNDIGNFPVIASANSEVVAAQISEARANAQLVIAMFHWGNEYQANPSNRQIMLAHTAVEAGADIVVGAHPHWVQTHEIYQGKPIYYSLGNFVFDQSWSEETKKGLAVEFTIASNNALTTRELPVYIYHNGQPAWVAQ